MKHCEQYNSVHFLSAPYATDYSHGSGMLSTEVRQLCESH